MTEPVNGWELLRSITDEIEDNGTAAAEFLHRIDVSGDAFIALVPIVTWAAGHERRSRGRLVEHSVFGSGSKRRTLGEVFDSREHRKRLLDESFPLGDGRWVSWAEATVADHEQRIALLAETEAGIKLTIKRHRDAIAKIREHGGTCLGDIGEAA